MSALGMSQIDRHQMKEKILAFPDMLEKALKDPAPSLPSASSVVVAGMGGSAIVGDVLRDWLEPPFKMEVCRGYHLPSWVSPSTLVVLISYSGMTEETLSCAREALRQGAKIVGISSGGELPKLLLDHPCLTVPSGFPPRAAFPYLFGSAVRVLQGAGLLPKEKMTEIQEALTVLRGLRQSWDEMANIAGGMLDKMVFIYAPPGFESAALRCKTQLNENSKVSAKVESFPELCHNEIVGLRSVPNNVCFVFLRDGLEEKRIKVRIEFTKRLVSGRKVMELWSKGEGKLARLLSLIFQGDMISYHLAILRGVDPTPVDEITELKRILAETPDGDPADN